MERLYELNSFWKKEIVRKDKRIKNKYFKQTYKYKENDFEY